MHTHIRWVSRFEAKFATRLIFLHIAAATNKNTLSFNYLNVPASQDSFLSFHNGIEYVFQEDGNFVAYDRFRRVVVETASNQRGNQLSLVFQDGDLAVFNLDQVVWSTKTFSKGANLVIRDRSPYIEIVDPRGEVIYKGIEPPV